MSYFKCQTIRCCIALLIIISVGSFRSHGLQSYGRVAKIHNHMDNEQKPMEMPITNKKIHDLSTQRKSSNTDMFDMSEEIVAKKAADKSDQIWKARALLVTVSALYGTNFGCVKVLEDSLDPGVAAMLRFSLAAVVFFPNLIRGGFKDPTLVFAGLEIGLYSALGYWAQAVALQTTSAGTAAFICSLAVIVVPILDHLFGASATTQNKSTIATFLPALLATAGVACLELGGTSVPGIGDLWALLQPIFFGLGFWRVETHMRNFRDAGDAQAFTGAIMAFISVFSIIWTAHDFVWPLLHDQSALTNAVQGQISAIRSGWIVPASIAWTGIVTTALTVYGENIAMKDLSAAESTVIYSTEPLWGTLFAAVTLGETVGWNTLFGAVLIISACLWSSFSSHIVGILSGGLPLFSTEIAEEMTENIGVNVAELLEQLKNVDA